MIRPRNQAVLALLTLLLAASGLGCEASEGGAAQEYGTAPVASAPSLEDQRAADDARARADLESDVRSRTEAARATYGDDVPLRVESGLFVLVGAQRGAPFEPTADLAQRGLDVYLGSFFARRPDRAVTVYVVRTMGAYAELCDARFTSGCERELGAYSRKTRDVIVNVGPGLPSVLHELVHPLVQSDFPRAPVWFEEGIAALFEKPVFDPPGELHGGRNWRSDRLAGALQSPAQRAKVHLPTLFALDDERIDGPDQDLDYAMSRAFCHWLDGRGQLWPFYRAWRDSVAEDPRGDRSFARVTGMIVAEADGAWLNWVGAGMR